MLLRETSCLKIISSKAITMLCWICFSNWFQRHFIFLSKVDFFVYIRFLKYQSRPFFCQSLLCFKNILTQNVLIFLTLFQYFPIFYNNCCGILEALKWRELLAQYGLMNNKKLAKSLLIDLGTLYIFTMN